MARRTSWFLLSACAFLAAAPAARALDPDRALTQYVHRIWQIPEDLASSTIYSLWQTRDGYLWLGTQNGLVRFDGVHFTHAQKIYEGLPDNLWIRDGFEDAQGTLWVATNGSGVYRLRDGFATHYSMTEGLPADLVMCVNPSKNGGMWACTGDGLALIGESGIRAYGKGEGIGLVNDVCEASDGKIWVARRVGVPMLFNGSEFKPWTFLPPDSSVRALLCLPDGVWLGTTNGLLHVRGDEVRVYTEENGLPDKNVVALVQGHDGNLWVGTRNGFSRFRDGEFDSFMSRDGLSQSSVLAMFEDREANLWVGTKHGLDQFLDSRAISYTTSEGLPSNNAGPILQDRAGQIWIGTLDAGLARFDGRRFETLTTREGLASNSILSLEEGRDGSLWVGTSRGVNRLRNGRVAAWLTTSAGLPSDRVLSLHEDDRGRLWAGTSAGLAVLEGGRFVTLPGSPMIPIQVIAAEAPGTLIVGTEQSTYRLQNGIFTVVGKNGVFPRDVVAVFTDPDGLVWMGTSALGLRLLDRTGKVTNFFVRDGLFDGEIYGFVLDDSDRLWVACSKGIYWVRRADLRRFADGAIKMLESTPYSVRDASRLVESKSGVQPVAAKMRDGTLWFSTTRGVISLDQNRLQLNTPPPPVVIEDPVVDGTSVRPELISQLPPGSNNLAFNYAGLSYVEPTRIRFKYILEGFDSEWIDAGTRREAFYTNLPPGDFRFRVTACDVEGACTEDSQAVEFSLAPHLYQQTWFWPTIVLLAALSVWLAYQMRVRRLHERYSLIVSERSRIARELHDTLIQGFSGVTMALQALAGRLPSSGERGALEEIIEDAAKCLRETRRSVAGLRVGSDPESGLPAAIADAARHLTETKGVRLNLKLDKSAARPLPPEVEYNLLRIATEAVSNSVKHSGASTIEVSLKYSPAAVRLSVRDDGRGFERRQNDERAPGHYGLTGMKERAAQIGAEFELKSGPGLGTAISLSLPSNGHSSAVEQVS
jgi:signal transduction histidine kinase/ligand-binding sensor domain-containing protein